MADLRQIQKIALENREAINKIVLDSRTIKQIPDAQNLTSDDYILVYDNTGNLTGKSTVNQIVNAYVKSAIYIEIDGVLYRLIKHATNSNQSTVEANDIIVDGYTDNVYISRARFTNALGDGDIHNIGTLAGFYKDGNYENVKYSALF